MATLCDQFLQDLEDLENEFAESQTPAPPTWNCEETGDIPDAVAMYDRSQTETVAVVSDMTSKADFQEILKDVRERNETLGSDVVSDEEYDLIEKCNSLVGKIDTEILTIHKFIRDIYSKKFPELESIVYSPLEYIAIVERVQNETDVTKIDLSDLLPHPVIMAVTVASSMTTGAPLPSVELSKVRGAGDEAMVLAECRKAILLFLESRMSLLAPNLSAILGSALAARLITHAGGLQNVARMPAQNIMMIGASKKSSMAMSTVGAGVSQGVICGSDIVVATPANYRHRALKLVAGKCGLAARVDAFRQSVGGEVGRAFKEQIVNSLTKIQEPPPAPQKKSLPVPDEKGRNRRGGKRYRRMKEQMGMSEMRKQANRMIFGPEQEDEYGTEGRGLGMLGKGTGLGKLKTQAKKRKLKIPTNKRRAPVAGSSGATGGMSSSLVFTPIQGIELCVPEASRTRPSNSDKYFSSSAPATAPN
eukprot:GHVN01059310.1.p1 GENE.GHVN01059310.1~~GHVN01059310.1.p1  ORF type:complete len:476 (-),score=64.84 GHVN01059310.1:181-1608(-)